MIAFLLIAWLALTPPGHWSNYIIAAASVAFAAIDVADKRAKRNKRALARNVAMAALPDISKRVEFRDGVWMANHSP